MCYQWMGVSFSCMFYALTFKKVNNHLNYALVIHRLLFTWGSNSFGQLGFGEFDTNEALPKLSKKLATKNIVQIACGEHHNLALTNGKCDIIHNFKSIVHFIHSNFRRWNLGLGSQQLWSARCWKWYEENSKSNKNHFIRWNPIHVHCMRWLSQFRYIEVSVTF